MQNTVIIVWGRGGHYKMYAKWTVAQKSWETCGLDGPGFSLLPLCRIFRDFVSLTDTPQLKTTGKHQNHLSIDFYTISQPVNPEVFNSNIMKAITMKEL